MKLCKQCQDKLWFAEFVESTQVCETCQENWED